MPEKTVPAREPSPISMLAGWLRQGTESFFASQRILMDLVMRQNAHTIGAFQGRLAEARHIAGTAVTEMAGEGISNFIAAQRVLLNLAQRQNEILTTVVKERAGGPAPVTAVTDLFSRGVDTVIDMQQHFLTLAARQADEWIDAAKSGEPFEGIHLTAPGSREYGNLRAQPEEVPGCDGGRNRTRHRDGMQRQARRSRKTELTELARQSAEAYIDAQKKLLDVAAQQLKVNAKTAREAINAMNPLPAETLGELVAAYRSRASWNRNRICSEPDAQRRAHGAQSSRRRRSIRNPAGKRHRFRRRKPVAETA